MPRLSIVAHGIVQGVGMRPFVYRAANAQSLVGWVKNDPSALLIEAQGRASRLRAFVRTLEQECPLPARVDRMAIAEIDEGSEREFHILESSHEGAARAVLPPDLSSCAACLEEVATPDGRRFRYPFTNCTACGPRATIVWELPYDRARTSMKSFTMCADCQREHDDPSDRRFHAQPLACPACGPELSLLVPDDGEPAARGEAALRGAIGCLARGGVLAVKGLGGFQLLVDATSEAAVTRLRARKRREGKPFAVLFASRAELARHCDASADEVRALASAAGPIVLVARGGDAGLTGSVSPGQPRVGAMLPPTPLHLLLAEGVARPLVCTSGNLVGEPMCTETDDALERLGAVADAFLVHDRAVARPMDDSVARLDEGGLTLLRRARGFAPLPLRLAEPTPTVLALGAQGKSTIALAMDGEVVVSQHLGDLQSLEGARLHERTARDMLRFFAARPDVIACDMHPDYQSTRLAERLAAELSVPLCRVQHHHAHVAACMAEHGLTLPVLGLAWDGAGYGLDGAIWGGEALACEAHLFRRVAHLRPFALAGGERAMREPGRAALGLLHAVFGGGAIARGPGLFPPREARALISMIDRAVHAPLTTSAGRLFDAVAALIGVAAPGARDRFEGEAAMALEHAAGAPGDVEPFPFPLSDGAPSVADWEPLVRALVAEVGRGASPGVLSARFHAALAVLAERIATRSGMRRIALTGGCFQNALLKRSVRERLEARGHEVYTCRRYPSNDGGLSLGQALVAARWLRNGGAPDVPRDSR